MIWRKVKSSFSVFNIFLYLLRILCCYFLFQFHVYPRCITWSLTGMEILNSSFPQWGNKWCLPYNCIWPLTNIKLELRQLICKQPNYFGVLQCPQAQFDHLHKRTNNICFAIWLFCFGNLHVLNDITHTLGKLKISSWLVIIFRNNVLEIILA